MKKILFSIAILFSLFTNAQTVYKDLTFGLNGNIIIENNNNVDNLNCKTIVQPDGKILIARITKGTCPFYQAKYLKLIRLNVNGTFDDSFGTNGIVIRNTNCNYEAIETVFKIELLNDNSILVFTQQHLVKFNSNGTIDSTFGTNGVILTGGYGSDAAVMQTDNKFLFLISNANNSFNDLDFKIKRCLANGYIDSSFGINGQVNINFGQHPINATNFYLNSFDFATCLAVYPDGKILIGGKSDVNKNMDIYQCALVRLNTDGTIDNTFGTNGYVISNQGEGSSIESLLILPNNDIMCVGRRVSNQGDSTFLMKFNENGTLSNSFGTNSDGVTNSNHIISKVYCQQDGKLLVGGSQFNEDNYFLSRYLQNGSLDANFGLNGEIKDAFKPPFFNRSSINDIFVLNNKIIVQGIVGSYFLTAFSTYIDNELLLSTQNNDYSKINFSPNPATDKINFNQKIKSIVVLTLDGKTIETKLDDKSVDVSHLSKGVYLLQIVDENNLMTSQKLIKN